MLLYWCVTKTVRNCKTYDISFNFHSTEKMIFSSFAKKQKIWCLRWAFFGKCCFSCIAFLLVFLSQILCLLFSLSTFSELFCGDLLETFVILSAILLPIKSPLASAAFLSCSFWSSFNWICSRLLSMIK